MHNSKFITDGTARDQAIQRRNAAMREALGKGPAPPNADKPPERKADERPSE